MHKNFWTTLFWRDEAKPTFIVPFFESAVKAHFHA